MTLLAELFDRLEHAPMAAAQRQAGRVEVGATVLAFETRQKPADAPAAPQAPAPTPIPVPPQNAPAQNVARSTATTETTSEPTRNAWTITRGGKPICRMVGAPCTHAEALAEARWRWPDVDILERADSQ